MKQKNGNHNVARFGAVPVLVALWVILPFAIGNRTASAEEMVTDVLRIGAGLTGASIGGVIPSGFAEYRVDDQNRRRLDVDGFSINLPSGTILTVSINNAVIGQTSVSPCSTFSFRRETDDGQEVAGCVHVCLSGWSCLTRRRLGDHRATCSQLWMQWSRALHSYMTSP